MIYLPLLSLRRGFWLVSHHWTGSPDSPCAPAESTQYLLVLLAQTLSISHQSTKIFLIPCHVIICLTSCQEESTHGWVEESGQTLRQLFVTQCPQGGLAFGQKEHPSQHSVYLEPCWGARNTRSLCLSHCFIRVSVSLWVSGCRRAAGVSWAGKKQLSHGLEQGKSYLTIHVLNIKNDNVTSDVRPRSGSLPAILKLFTLASRDFM